MVIAIGSSFLFIAEEQKLANFFCKGPESKNYSSASDAVSVAPTQLCHCCARAATDRTQTRRPDCTPMKIYFEDR